MYTPCLLIYLIVTKYYMYVFVLRATVCDVYYLLSQEILARAYI